MTPPDVSRGDSKPQLLIDIAVPGARAVLVVDRVGQHGAFGGVRIVPDLRVDELVAGARAMGRKFAFINVPIGGAKSAIEAPTELAGEERRRLLHSFGRAIAPLIRANTYLPACDMGTDESDLSAILSAAGIPLTPNQVDSSRATALTIVEAVRQVATRIGVPVSSIRLALEGLGKVGGHVASMLSAEGARLVAVSTADGALLSKSGLDVARLLQLRATHGSRLVAHYDEGDARRAPHRELFETTCDILLPGVRSHVIDATLADSIDARAVVPFSNAGVRPEAEERLTRRGVVVLPDYVANCGGIIAVDLRSVGFGRPDDVDRVVTTVYRDAVAAALTMAERSGVSIGEVCRRVAEENRRSLVDNSSPYARGVVGGFDAGPSAVMRRIAWRLHKRGVLPSRFRSYAMARFLEWRLDVTRARMIASPQS